jgi:hypothetical protein
MQDNAATNHINTWPIAYNTEVIREWLFEQLTNGSVEVRSQRLEIHSVSISAKQRA